MEKLVIIDSCMHEGSRTRRLLQAAVNELSTRYAIETFDVNALAFPPVSPEIMQQRNNGYVPERIVEVSRRIAAADRLVIAAAPFWDMSFPSALKVFFENMSLFHITFDSDDTHCYGLCRCSKVLYLTTRGMDIRTGDPLDQGSPYIKALSVLWGLGEVITVSAENMDYSSPEELESRIGEAIMQIRTVCRDF